MSAPFRVIDTGVREGRANIAFDAALIEAHKAGAVPDTIRFLQFRPTALVGRHQALAQEIHLDWCAANGVGLARRVTGGGALYMDEGQFGFELAFHRKTLGISALGDLARAICEAAAAGLQSLGVAARYRPRNDIEVDGRKISGTGGFFDGDTLFYQGTLLVDMDVERMQAALNTPASKLAKRGLESGQARIVTLRELAPEAARDPARVKAALLQGFANQLGIDPRPGAITAHEEALAQKFYDEEIGTEAFLREIDAPAALAGVACGKVQSPGGEISAYLRFEGPRANLVREALVTGDFFVTPPRVILDLEASLRGVERAALGEATLAFFARATPGILSARPEDFAAALQAAARAP
ncbi:MAG: lipoate--protein ligase family protein [Pseudomonadota bacterium]|nr:lipoate--protein ligase family protein [Pseudomonadota bacterium]